MTDYTTFKKGWLPSIIPTSSFGFPTQEKRGGDFENNNYFAKYDHLNYL